jgi:tetratricopeptide (TPR) repeat protein
MGHRLNLKGLTMNHLTAARLILLLSFWFCLGGNQPTLAQIREPNLARLQGKFAMRYLDPEPHMALAKYYFDQGNLLEAFYTVENARGRFEEAIFNPAFYRAFDGFDNSSAAEARLLSQHKLTPSSIETIDGLADIYISREDWPKAKLYLRRALQMKPEDFRFTSGLARVLGSEGKPEEAAAITKAYVQKFPETVDGYGIRIDELIEANPARARAMLTEALMRFPTDGRLQFDLGILFQKEDNLAKAEEAFLKAAELSPSSVYIQSWVGRFLFKVRVDNPRALKYYLRAYFLDPHAYESEFVESRIQKINFQLAAAKLETQIAAGTSLVSMLDDPNPMVAGLALEKMAEKWRPSYVDQMVRVMGHDNQNLRWQATQVLKKNVDKSFDERLTALLKDDDLRKRGLAAYIAVFRWQAASFGFVKDMLSENAQLLRFDALSALMLEGGEAGRKIVLAHGAHESNPTLKELIQSASGSQPVK